MNRRTVSNAVVSIAGILASTNAEADAEIAQLQTEVEQLRNAIAPLREVVKIVREDFSMGALPGPVEVEMGSIFRVPADAVKRLRTALKGCP